MNPASDSSLPLLQSECPTQEQEVAAVVVEAARNGMPVYPLGGGTGQGLGMPVTRPGVGLSLAKMNRVIDYPARDMTITVEAGMVLADLQQTLASEGQWLPIDPPGAERCQMGGLVAMNASGPRRYGYGTPREYIIGIRGVDGRGMPFQAGGRVVKNVAGYDFCRLLAGSRGTLAVITQITWKLRPLPLKSAILTADIALERLESVLAGLNTSAAMPVAVQVDSSATDCDDAVHLGIAVEGSPVEVAWQVGQLTQELAQQEISPIVLAAEAASARWHAWQAFPLAGSAALRFRVQVLPHGVARLIQAIRQELPAAEIVSQAGSGVIDVGLPELPPQGLTRAFTKSLAPLAIQQGGYLTITHHPSAQELTPELLWGGAAVPWRLIHAIQQQFDPQGILNPRRFFPHA